MMDAMANAESPRPWSGSTAVALAAGDRDGPQRGLTALREGIRPSDTRRARAEAATAESMLLFADGSYGEATLAARRAIGLARGELAADPGGDGTMLVLLAVDQSLRSTMRAAGTVAVLQLLDEVERWSSPVPDLGSLLVVRRAAALAQADPAIASDLLTGLDAEQIGDAALRAEAYTRRAAAEALASYDRGTLLSALEATATVDAVPDPWDRRAAVESWLLLARTLHLAGASALTLGELGDSAEAMGASHQRVLDVVLERAARRSGNRSERAAVLLAALECGATTDAAGRQWVAVPLGRLGIGDNDDDPGRSLLDGVAAPIESLVEDGESVRDPDIAARLLRQAGVRARRRHRAAPFLRAAEIWRGLGDLDRFCDDILAAAAQQTGDAGAAADTLDHALRVLDVHDALNRRRAAEVATAALLVSGDSATSAFSVARADNTVVLGGHRAGPAGMVRFDLGGSLTLDVDALDLSVLRIAERVQGSSTGRMLPLLAGEAQDSPLLGVPVAHGLLRWFASLGATLLAFEASVGAHPLSRAMLLLQWATLCRQVVDGERFVDEEECQLFEEDARAAFEALPARAGAVLAAMCADETSLVLACEAAIFGGVVTPHAREEAARLASALRSIGVDAPEVRTIEEELRALSHDEPALPLRVFAGPGMAAPSDVPGLPITRAEALEITRLVAVESRRGGYSDWPAVEAAWRARHPGMPETFIDELTVVRSSRGMPVLNGLGWAYWRAQLTTRRLPLPPISTWDARWETRPPLRGTAEQ